MEPLHDEPKKRISATSGRISKNANKVDAQSDVEADWRALKNLELPIIFSRCTKNKKAHDPWASVWELRGSNPRPSACKADALNQLS